ncbi:hypothetical protein LDFHOB_11700 [Candidatus Electronema aureum]
MPTQLIQLLESDILVEVEVPQDQVHQISGGMPEQVDVGLCRKRALQKNIPQQ